MIDRLKEMDRGDLNALKDAITNKQFAQDWSLDATGNWRSFREDTDGDSSWDLAQNRTSNTVNEITDITESAGPAWVTPVYNRAGNMTTIPKPADPTASFAATYDAWNRLVRIEDGANKVSEYEYDGAKRRTTTKTYSGGVLDATRHFYYTEPSKWQVVEERVDASSNPQRQFVWGLRYIDDLVLRGRDTTGDGTLDERFYALQDANWNLTALCDTAGSVLERFAYTSYGVSAVLTAAFGSRATSSYVWEVTFAGYRWDAELQMFQVRHRVYRAGLGWIQRDLVRHGKTLNLYEYCDGKPSSASDPLRLLVALPAMAIITIGLWVMIAVLTLTLLLELLLLIKAGCDIRIVILRWPKETDDPCRSDYDACLLTSLADQGFGNRCHDCWLACRGRGTWTREMNGLDCAYWNYPSQE